MVRTELVGTRHGHIQGGTAVVSGEYTHAWKVPATFTPKQRREHEVAALKTFLMQRQVRLLTVTGVAGVGKTRLSLEVPTALRSCFADGVSFVDLAVLSDPGLVLSTLVERLEIKDGGCARGLGMNEASLPLTALKDGSKSAGPRTLS